MIEEEPILPAGLHPLLVKRLLDRLESDQGFRKLFQESPEKALRSIGYTDPWVCMGLKSGRTLAAPEQIKSQRNKLEDALVNIQGQICVLDTQEGYFPG